jgi:HemK-like putative methylase
MALSVFKFLYAYTFQKPFFFADNKTIFSNEKKIEFKKYVDQITLFDIPYQYILKHVPFIDADIEVSPPILIPRNETEWWTDWLIKKLQKKKNERLFIADICSGSGCIGISLLQSFQNSFCDAFDISHQAITLSSKNVQTFTWIF